LEGADVLEQLAFGFVVSGDPRGLGVPEIRDDGVVGRSTWGVGAHLGVLDLGCLGGGLYSVGLFPGLLELAVVVERALVGCSVLKGLCRTGFISAFFLLLIEALRIDFVLRMVLAVFLMAVVVRFRIFPRIAFFFP
jgi:hypothetical protein